MSVLSYQTFLQWIIFLSTHTMNETIWLFDLDNTLHHADSGIFPLINHAMTEFMAKNLNLSHQDASQLREAYWQRYGATLAGLKIHHPEIDIDEFLRFSHPIPEILSQLQAYDYTETLLQSLNGRKAIFSNGPSFYAEAIIKALGLSGYFELIAGTDKLDYLYKPNPQSYRNICHLLDVLPQQCILVDDSAANLKEAKKQGMKTVWFGSHTSAQPFADVYVKSMCDWLHHTNKVGAIMRQSS